MNFTIQVIDCPACCADTFCPDVATLDVTFAGVAPCPTTCSGIPGTSAPNLTMIGISNALDGLFTLNLVGVNDWQLSVPASFFFNVYIGDVGDGCLNFRSSEEADILIRVACADSNPPVFGVEVQVSNAEFGPNFFQLFGALNVVYDTPFPNDLADCGGTVTVASP